MIRSVLAVARRTPGVTLLALVTFVAITGWIAWRFLVLREPWQLLVDLEVYREAGISVVTGRPIYTFLTPTPQLLPFTYPPVAALFAVPLSWVPLRPLGWMWTVMQMVLLAGVVAVAFRPLLARLNRTRPLTLAALAGALLWLLPLKDGIMFGQVDILLLALCLADYVAHRPWWPRGLLVGVATALKLTPGVFILHWWFAGRRREAATATATAVGMTIGTFVLLPGDSADFWLRAVLDSDRLGNNAGTSNQAIRGMLLRFGLDVPVLWLVLVAIVGYAGFRASVRCARAGAQPAACAIVGLLAVLLSPVAWIHHLAWIVLVIAVVVGDGRDRTRLAAAAGVWLYFFFHIPWWGAGWADDIPILVARLLQDAYGFAALGLIPIVARYGLRDAERQPSESRAFVVR